jgi:hypothetical protein
MSKKKELILQSEFLSYLCKGKFEFFMPAQAATNCKCGPNFLKPVVKSLSLYSRVTYSSLLFISTLTLTSSQISIEYHFPQLDERYAILVEAR